MCWDWEAISHMARARSLGRGFVLHAEKLPREPRTPCLLRPPCRVPGRPPPLRPAEEHWDLWEFRRR